MQLGKALVGAVIGGVLGIGLLVLLHTLTGWDKAWLAIPVALLTGLGVRWMVSTKGHPSYARGALTAILAILAFTGGNYLVAELATHRTIARADAAPASTRDAGGERDDDAEPAEPAPAPLEPVRLDEPSAIGGGGVRNPRPQQFSTWDFLWICIAALLAYELGRGTGAAAPGARGGHDDKVAPVAVGQTAVPPD